MEKNIHPIRLQHNVYVIDFKPFSDKVTRFNKGLKHFIYFASS